MAKHSSEMSMNLGMMASLVRESSSLSRIISAIKAINHNSNDIDYAMLFSEDWEGVLRLRYHEISDDLEVLLSTFSAVSHEYNWSSVEWLRAAAVLMVRHQIYSILISSEPQSDLYTPHIIQCASNLPYEDASSILDALLDMHEHIKDRRDSNRDDRAFIGIYNEYLLASGIMSILLGLKRVSEWCDECEKGQLYAGDGSIVAFVNELARKGAASRGDANPNTLYAAWKDLLQSMHVNDRIARLIKAMELADL